MNILYCTTVLPSRRRTGGEIASQSFIDALRQAGHSVTVFGYRRPEDTTPVGLGEVVVGVRPIETEAAGIKPLAWMLSALLLGRPYSSEKYVSDDYRQVLREHLRIDAGSVVVLDHAQMAFLASDLPSTQALVFVAHNVETELYSSQLASVVSKLRRYLLLREARLIGRLEFGLAGRASQTWVLTEHDASIFRRESSCRNVVRLDLPGVARVADGMRQCKFSWDVGLIGTWTWGANAQGLRWFVDKVVPRLPREVQVAVAGKGADGFIKPPVESLGFVPDAMDFMSACRVVCIPSIAGGGVQIKTIDAIASGRPIVATSVALRGIEEPPESVSVTDDPELFALRVAEAVVRQVAGSQEAVDWARLRAERFATQIQRLIGQIGEK